MALQAKEIKDRLRSIKNTRKITKAMELVSAAKMRRAVGSVLETRPYADAAWNILDRLSKGNTLADEHPLKPFFTPAEEGGHTTIVMFTSNRGLAGAFNTNVSKEVFSQIQNRGIDNVELIGIGTKGISRLNSVGIKATLAYAKDDTARNESSVAEIARHVFDKMQSGETNRVLVVYTSYESALSQVVRVQQLYPITREVVAMEMQDPDYREEAEFLYEPDAEAILAYLVPRIAEVELFQALLESNASEHSARMVAMKSATDAAGDMASDLLLAYNRARQASITKEIAEISAGSAALNS